MSLLTEHPFVSAVLAALLSACTFALGTSLQHRSSGKTPDHAQSRVRVFVFLVSQPMWLLGLLVAFGALLLHALALSLGSLAVVQPVMISGIVLAIPLRAAMSRHLPTLREMRPVVLTAVSLAVFLVAANPEPATEKPAPGLTAVVILSGLGCGVLIAKLAPRRLHRREAFMLGAASGILFGLTAVLLKLIVGHVKTGGLLELLTSWEVLLLVIVGVMGTGYNQRAYRVAPLAASMPALNVVEVLVAVLLGAWLFGEQPALSALALGVQAVALAGMAVGLRGIGRLHVSPSAAGSPTMVPGPVGSTAVTE